MEKNLKLCVYCGSGPGIDPQYMAAARTLGTAMAKANIGLVYGGGSLGLMGETARAVLEAGGHVTGIIPEFLIKQEMMLEDVQDLVVTTNKQNLLYKNWPVVRVVRERPLISPSSGSVLAVR